MNKLSDELLGVNRVSLINRELMKPIVRKVYSSNALSTGIALPIARSTIEKRTAYIIKRLFRPRSLIKSSQFLKMTTNPSVAYMIHVSGVNVRKLNCDEFPHKSIFIRLGYILGKMNRINECEKSFIFSNLRLVSRKSAIAVWQYKTRHKQPFTHSSLCLGDVNLNNMLWDGKTLTLLDFEFCHLGLRGFDAGNILAELKSTFHRNTKARGAYFAIIQGYQLGGGSVKAARYAESLLRNYYKKKERGV